MGVAEYAAPMGLGILFGSVFYKYVAPTAPGLSNFSPPKKVIHSIHMDSQCPTPRVRVAGMTTINAELDKMMGALAR